VSELTNLSTSQREKSLYISRCCGAAEYIKSHLSQTSVIIFTFLLPNPKLDGINWNASQLSFVLWVWFEDDSILKPLINRMIAHLCLLLFRNFSQDILKIF
jgi:hypothetical protein